VIIYEVEITQEMVSNAKILADELGVLNNSIRNGTGNLAGFLGEECVLKCFKNSRRDRKIALLFLTPISNAPSPRIIQDRIQTFMYSYRFSGKMTHMSKDSCWDT